MNRNLDGLYFRIKRGETYDNICFSDLTKEERYEVMKDRNEDWYKSICNHLAIRLKTIGDETNYLGE